MATAQAIDVDRRSLPLLLGRCFLAVASCPKRDTTPWGINSAGPGRVESGLAPEDLPMKTRRLLRLIRSRGGAANSGGLATRNAASRGPATRPALRCARLQISRLSAVEPAGGLDEPEPGWLASTEDTDEVDAHHACGRHLRRRVHRTGGAGASGRHVAHAARLRDAAGTRGREPAL